MRSRNNNGNEILMVNKKMDFGIYIFHNFYALSIVICMLSLFKRC